MNPATDVGKRYLLSVMRLSATEFRVTVEVLLAIIS